MFSLIPWGKKDRERTELAAREEFSPERFRQEFDALFDRFFRGWPALAGPWWTGDWTWGLDVHDDGSEVTVRAEAPGFEAQDFDVQISGNLLTIRAERKHEERKSKGDARFAEERYSQFRRAVTLPDGLDVDKVEARYRNGVLEVRIPRKPEAKGRKIHVKT
ncbi:MAG: Hsp20/alpha crystallin family protein [Gemmataceae bacterium]|nr:Hsp20/alpha crystallin family protein [Gemmataceae bacterium]MDW8266913.1 Hsp20/alpha crystallin family protein [Gemmataceae bacterium]